MDLVLRSLSWVEVCRREPELRRLTDTRAFSDMNKLLDQAQMGNGPSELLAGAIAEVEGRPVGWATCEAFRLSRRRSYTLFNVFVHPDHRSQGLGTILLNAVVPKGSNLSNVCLTKATFTRKTLLPFFPDAD